jgi:hypothetical protein
MNRSFLLFKKARTSHLMLLFFLLFLYTTNSYSQVGLGTQAMLNHPGLIQSKKHDIRFKAGSGYGFFVRHDVYDSNSVDIDFRYIAVVSEHKANLPLGEKAKYDFSNFSIEVLIKSSNSKPSSFYAGFGIGLLSLNSTDRFRQTYTDQTFYPLLIGGWSYNWAEGFDLFMEIKAGFGSNDAGPESIPVTGLSFNLGLTMYITE